MIRNCKHCGKPFGVSPRFKAFCSAECREAYREKAKMKICKWCGKQFVSSRRYRDLCSVRCRTAYYGKGKWRNCAECGKLFRTSFHLRKFCSPECREARAKRARLEYLKAYINTPRGRALRAKYRETMAKRAFLAIAKGAPRRAFTVDEVSHIKNYRMGLTYGIKHGHIHMLTISAGGSRAKRWKDRNLFKKNVHKVFYALSPLDLTRVFIESINWDFSTKGQKSALNYAFRRKVLPLWEAKRG